MKGGIYMKKIFASMSLIIAFLISSLPVSALDNTYLSTMGEYKVLDDKGMLADADYYKREGYKMIYLNGTFYRAEPAFRYLEFILSEDVNYEEADKRVEEIFDEFYLDNGLDYTYEYKSSPDHRTYNFEPSLTSQTVDGVTTYTVCVAHQTVSSIDDERVAKAKKYSKDFMNKLNEENLISAFYDFGEVYEVDEWDYITNFKYNKDVDIEKVKEYISENNINCTIENVNDWWYEMKFNDDTDMPEQFSIAADVYEATSIGIEAWNITEPWSAIMCYKDDLEEISSEKPIDPTEPTEPTNEKITDVEEICKLLNDFAEECQIPDFKATVSPANEEISIDRVSVFWRGDTMNCQIKYLIQKFIEEKNIDEAKIFGIPGEVAIIGWFCDINGDKKSDVRDCAYLASSLAKGEKLNYKADYNTDGKVDVRDAAGIAHELALLILW